jgi:AbrB family looped-hinge helix DNA binding protein
MSEEQKTWTFNAEDIFEDIPDDPENVIMNIPEEIREAVGLKEGDPIRVLWGDQGSIVIEKITQEEYNAKTKEK